VGKNSTEQPRWPARRRRWSSGRERATLPLHREEKEDGEWGGQAAVVASTPSPAGRWPRRARHRRRSAGRGSAASEHRKRGAKQNGARFRERPTRTFCSSKNGAPQSDGRG
jgi:hypothetical protein